MHQLHLSNWLRKGAAWAALLPVAGMSLASVAHAQMPIPVVVDENKSRIEQLEKELQELKALIKQQQVVPVQAQQSQPDPDAVKKIIDERFKEKEDADKKKKEDAAALKKFEGSVVGDNTKLEASWDNGGLRFKSEDGAFSIHIGGRLMTDDVWFSQSPGLKLPQTPSPKIPGNGQTGVGPGIGDLQDGAFIRRARFVADGQIYQTLEYKSEFDVENYNNLTFDEMYAGARDLPFIDTVRLGQMHVPFGLEAYASSRWLPQMERSPLFDAFYQEFGPGIFTNTTFMDQRVTWQNMFHRIDAFNQFSGDAFGDGKYAYSGRVSALPIYENEGRCLLHLAADYQWRKGTVPSEFNGGTTIVPPAFKVTQNTDIVRFRTRQSIRDAAGAQGDNNRMVDTGNIIADDVQSVNFELLGYAGPVWIQSETVVAHVDNAFFPVASAGKPTTTGHGDLNFWGSYVQVGYFLTGEKRGYDKRMGKAERVVPNENFFLVRDENGHAQYGTGAWELNYRFAFVDLNDGGIQGGSYAENTFGVNWYWSPNIKIQANYINGHRLVPAGADSGTVNGVGLRAALEF